MVLPGARNWVGCRFVAAVKTPDGRKSFYARDRRAWRAWLEKNHARGKGVWLIRYKVKTGKQCVPYVDSVEEALCFGWIDGQEKPVDDERYLQLFTPRRPRSTWAATNKARVERLIADGSMMPAGIEVIERAKKDGSWSSLDAVEALTVPDDLAKAFAKATRAARNYEAFSPSVRKSYLYWLAQAKRPETRAKRIAEIVRWCAANTKFADAMTRKS